MYSLEVIEQINREAASAACEDDKEPLLITSEEQIADMPPFPFPALGDYVPLGWRDTGERLFCDSSGIGAPEEPALTTDQLKLKLEVGKAYAIVEEGQFQVYLGVFEEDK